MLCRGILENGREAVGEAKHDGAGNQNADDNGENWWPEFHLETAWNERASPGASARKWNSDQDDEPKPAVFVDGFLVFISFSFEPGDYFFGEFFIAQKVKDFWNQK